jgi:poly(3-hydroxybutyrate) depolymerase
VFGAVGQHRTVATIVASLLLPAAVSLGCGDVDSTDDAVGDEPALSGTCEPTRPFDAGEYDRVNVSGDVEQPYWVIVPDAYSGDEPLPLMLLLPGGDGDRDKALAGFAPVLDDDLGIVVVADLTSPDQSSVEVIDSLIDQVATEFCVDESHVDLFGSSASARFSAEIISARPDRVAAAAIGLQSFPPDDAGAPVPILAWTGNSDRSSTVRSVEAWAEVNGCDGEPMVTDLGSGISHVSYTGCEEPLELYDIDGMGHQIPVHDCSGMDPAYAGFCAEFDQFDLFEEAAAFFAANPGPSTREP